MNANEVIEAYVADVAARLPRKQRNDVAFELRALLGEGLQAHAEDAGRVADSGMAIDFVKSFGAPAEVAARYRSTLTIIDPADGRGFLRATVIGLAIIWALGLAKAFGQPIRSAWDLLSVLGQWWGSSVIPSLWWPGLLVVSFGLASWTGRRWPQSAEWKPRAKDGIQGCRAGIVTGMVGILCGLFVLAEPRWVLDFFWNGKAAPAAYEALTYTESFRQRQGPWLFALLAAYIPLYAIVVVKGRAPVLLQRIETGLGLVICALMAWTVLDGPVFMAERSDRMTKYILVSLIAFMLIHYGVQYYRRVRPAPDYGIGKAGAR